MKTFFMILILLVLTALTVRCGTNAKASNTIAQEIPGPAGATCYAIFDDGRAISGNCVKN